MKNLFFFGLGIGVTVFVVIKGRELARKATPAHVQQSVQRKADELWGEAREFIDEVRTSMHEREAELRTELGLDKS